MVLTITMIIINRPFYESRRLHGITDVVAALETLEHDLPLADLQLLQNFNHTYLIITKHVRRAIRKGQFQHPDFLEKFDTRFAHYYLRALKSYLTNGTVPPAWRQAFRSAKTTKASGNKAGNVSALVIVGLGVNAHINNDIAQVLLDCQASPKHYADYRRINTVIAGSINEVLDNIQSSNKWFGPQQKLLKPLYKLVMNCLVRLMRFRAWQNFKKLQQQSLSIHRIESTANRFGWFMSKLPL